MWYKGFLYWIGLGVGLLLLQWYTHPRYGPATGVQVPSIQVTRSVVPIEAWPIVVQTPRDIRVGDYFEYMDSLIGCYRHSAPYPLTEHLLVRHNPWIIDTLAHTDYYRMMARDSFVYDQRRMIVLPKGSEIELPDSMVASGLIREMEGTEILVNIPEFTLRIFQDSLLLYAFPIRVGQNRTRFLAMSGRDTDLRTKTGTGRIIQHVRNPQFYNPVDGKQFYLTKRDDGKTTMMPQIPWLETEINGIRNGQMIHPTTNPITLGKAYSNGCIGTREGDAWIIYYQAPLDTRIRITYQLGTKDSMGREVRFRDVYGYSGDFR